MGEYKLIAEKFSDGKRMEHPQRIMIYSSWLEACGNLQRFRVLDLGCGSGDSSRLLAKNANEVIGIDKEPLMLEIAKRKYQNSLNIKYCRFDATRLPTFKKKFNLATAAFLLHYSESKEELRNMIQGIARNLKTGSRLIAILVNPEKPIVDYYPGMSAVPGWHDQPWEEGSRIKITYYDDDGKEKYSFKNYWWQKSTYEQILSEVGFDEINWIQPKMNKQQRKLYTNWKLLENYNVIILSATLTRRIP